MADEHGRPDDGTNPTGFFNAEFYVGLKPYSEWTGPIRTKQQLVDSIDAKLASFTGVNFNYTQPAEDAVNEAETGLKSSLDVKVFGPDLELLEKKGRRDQERDRAGAAASRTSRWCRSWAAQPHGEHRPRAHRALRHQRGRRERVDRGGGRRQRGHDHRAGRAARSIWWCGCGRSSARTPEEIGNILVAAPGGQQIPMRELADIKLANGAAFIYREDNSRFIGIQYSVEGRDLAGAVQEAQRKVAAKVKVPPGYRMRWGGEYEDYTASRGQLRIVLPLTLVLIFIILFALYSNFKFPWITVVGVVLSGPLGGLFALKLTGTPFSASSGIGFLALFGVSVQTAVVYISYVNELRREGMGIAQAASEGALLRLRPIMMTALVAAIGLLPAALSTGVGSDSQRPFALVIVGGLFSRLLISVFLMPALYTVVARPGDRLEV